MASHRRNPSLIIPAPKMTMTINELLEYESRAIVPEDEIHLVAVRSGQCRMYHVLRDNRPLCSVNGKYELLHNDVATKNNNNSNTMACNDNDVRACMNEIEKIGKHLNVKESEVEFAMNILKSTSEIIKARDKKEGAGESSSKGGLTPDIYEAYKKHIKSNKPMKQVAIRGEGGLKAKEENWGTWQRMGGDLRVHKTFDLSGAPYTPAVGMKWVGPEDLDYPDDSKDAGAKADPSVKMVPSLTPEQQLSAVLLMEIEKLDKNKKTRVNSIVVDGAKGFDEEDDDAFIPNIVRPLSERVELKGLRGAVLKHKNVESLRKLMSPVAPPSSLSNSPYLNALGSSGVAPPPGVYNSFTGLTSSPESGLQWQHSSGITSTPGMASTPGTTSNSGMTSTPSTGLPAQNPFQSTTGQSVTSSQLSHWSQATTTTPTLGFYETMAPGTDSGNQMGTRRSSLGHIARSASRTGMSSNLGSGTPLRADSPAFHSALGSASSKPAFPSPEFGMQAMQQSGVQGQQTGAGVSGRTGSRAVGTYAQPSSTGTGSGGAGRANEDGLSAAARNLHKWLS